MAPDTRTVRELMRSLEYQPKRRSREKIIKRPPPKKLRTVPVYRR